jgi:microcystin degradation protein MlrC
MSKRVLLAGIYHETNTFLRGVTGVDAFERRDGDTMFAAEGDASPLGGVLETARERGWEVVPVLDMRAMPSGMVADAAVETFWTVLREAAEREIKRGLDGIYLVLHGAMVSESLPDVEGELLRRLHRLEGVANIPVCGVLDFHANATEAMGRYSSGLIAYRQNPHTDAKQAAMDAAALLDRLMQTGERPVTLWEHPPLMWPPTGVGTATEPMRLLEARAREIEQTEPDILAVNVFGGFAFADMPEAGVSFNIVTLGATDKARSYLYELSALALFQKEEGNRTDMPLEQALAQLPKHKEGPILLVEPADNIGGGAPGDITVILRALVENRIDNAGVIIDDAESVQALAKRALGETVRLAVGGKSGELGSEPLPLEVTLISRSDGRFTLEDPHSHLASMFGSQIDMGPCAVVRHAGVTILLTSRKTPPFDLGQWRSQGIDPEKLAVIAVKAAVAHRQAYDPITKASYTVETPGPCASNLHLLPFRRVRRPIYPLDEIGVEG